MQVTLEYYLVVAAVILAAGVATMMLRKNALGKLLGVELIMTAAALNFAAFGAYAPWRGIDGEVFAFMVMLIAAVQTAVAVAVVVSCYRAGGRV